MNTRYLVLALFGAVSLALSGCAGDTSNDNPTPSSSTTETPGGSTSATSSIVATTTSSETTPEATTIPETGTVKSEEHTSELQSRGHLVCRLLLEKKKKDMAHQNCRR